MQVKLTTRDGLSIDKFKRPVEDITADRLARIRSLILLQWLDEHCSLVGLVSSDLHWYGTQETGRQRPMG